MPDYDDIDRRDDGFDDRGPRGNVIALGRAKVSAPGLLLIIFGLIGAVVEVGSLTAAFTAPTVFADWYRGFIESQPAGPQKDEMLRQFKEQEAGMRFDSPMNIGGTAFGLLVNLLMVLGGAKMRSLSSYGLSMTGAIAAIIPISGCCCFAIPLGVWAIVVLANADVKAAFAATARGTAGGLD